MNLPIYIPIKHGPARERVIEFAKAYAAWVDAGCPPHKHFKKFYGLCRCLDLWVGQTSEWFPLQNAMNDSWHEDSYPFGGRKAFVSDMLHGAHLNQQRMTWVRWAANMPQPTKLNTAIPKTIWSFKQWLKNL